MNCIIVDDEQKARVVLQRLIELNCPNLNVVALCENLAQARQAILEQSPDIVFLDLNLPNEFGFELISQIKERTFSVILTTAHEEYAAKAFEYNAQDYLLKPIYSQRLIEAVEKASSFLSVKASTQEKITIDPNNQETIDKIPFPVEDGMELINVNDIIRIEACGSYCKVHLISGKPLLISKNMKPLEALLEGKSFYRIHNSHLINLKHLKKIQKINGGLAIMSDDSYAEISRRKLNHFLKVLFPEKLNSN